MTDDDELPAEVRVDLVTVFGEIIPRLDEETRESVLWMLSESRLLSEDDIELASAVAYERYAAGSISADTIWTAHTATFDVTPDESLHSLLPEALECENVRSEGR